MHPILFKLGPITIYTYGVMVALGIFFGSWVLLKLAEREGIDKADLSDVGFWTVVIGVVGARLFYFLYNPQYFKPLYKVLYIWQGGFVFYGGVIFGTLTAIVLSRLKHIPLWKLADISSIALALGMGFGRIGCTMAGCCYGIPCYHCPFAITFTDPHSAASPLGVPLWPTEPMSSIANFTIAGLLYLIYRSKRFDGEVFSLYLIFYGVFRFLIEFVRATPKVYWGFSNNQIISVIMVIAGLILIYAKRRK
jgi:phosphatidylglycerol:prolipoprotein diacylglycerol transferase